VKIKDDSNSLENGWNIEETDANLITEISQVFIFDNDDKNIFMTFESVDKSLNKTDLKKTEKFTIDTVAPQILKYSFEPATEDDISDTETFIEELEYGFYFKKDFNASVLSDDATPTSGLDKVVFRMVSYENGEQSNEEIVEAAIENKKAVCLVQAGFKGQIYAQSLDRGANKSEEETPQAFVIDETAPVIKIDPLPSTSYTDSEGNKLYTSSVDFKVTVTDEKAGLKQLVYSKSSEKNSHNDVVTAIGNTRGYDDNATLENGWEIVKTDRNLVTEVSQIFHFSEDDNNITMNFSAEDRAHNLSDTFSSERFTIDTINPKVVISNPVSPVNGMYYQDSTTFTITVTERNFNADLMESKVENSYTSAVPAVKFSPAGANVYTASVTFPEGDYIFSFTGEDRGGHKTEIQADRADYTTTAFSADFKVDATEPKLETNFDEFGKHDDSEIYFNTSKTVEITVNEHNFDKNSFDIVKLESKASGTPHNKDDAEWFEISFDSKWEKEKTQDDVYILKIPLEENAVYKVSVEPIDLSGKRAKKTESAIFEIDTVSPELYSRSDKTINDKDFVTSPYCEVFDEKKKDAPSPVVEFEGLNFDHIEVEATVYLPEYKNGMEYGEVVPDGLSEKLTCNVDKKEFSIPKQSFEKDGVYALTYVAVDKAGNKSKPVNDTYFKMINTDVLAYLYHSSKTDGTGYYSLMDDSGKAISKKATDFQDLDIFVIKKKTEDNKNKEQEEQVGNIMIRDDDNEYSPKDYIQPNEEKISETSVLTKNRLPSSYFSDTFKDDSLDKRMYLSVSIHDNAYLDLAALHIDNERPSATLPEHFVSWHNYMFTNEVTIELSNITETLNEELCKVYECPRGKERVEIPFTYSKENKTLSFVLDKGLHNIDITLADEAKNEWDINRVRYLRVGNFRLYLGIGITALIAGAVVMINLLKKRGTISK
ncbi:MAG: hypothetical protein IIT42_02875, partial [Clostridia bacterium]|nr:hypothetical protein [Clostridia bacterium]